MKKLTKFIEKYKWGVAPLLYIAMCVYAFFGTTVTISGIQVQQPEAGFYGLLLIHAIIGIAVVGALIIHWITKLISKLFN